MTVQSIQQWTTKYNDLTQKWDATTNAINSYKSINGAAAKSPALFEAQRQQLRLEYNINQHIESAYTPEMLDTYLTYQSQKIGTKTNVPIDGILYNNTGQPLTWNPNSTWGI